MDPTKLPPLYQAYTGAVLLLFEADAATSSFRACFDLLQANIHKVPAWQIAMPAIACVAAGGMMKIGTTLAAAWLPAYLASELFDQLEDKEFIPGPIATSPEVGMNLATGLLFLAYHYLATIPDPGIVNRAVQIFSEAGIEAAYGQHRSLTRSQVPVKEALDAYWEMIILKSGSVFRTAMVAGGAAGTADKSVLEALGDYGTALGVILQLLDDCRDLFSKQGGPLEWEISLPLLLYLMIQRKENISFPAVQSKAEVSSLFARMGVVTAVSSILLEWKNRALQALDVLPETPEKRLLESLPTFILEPFNENSTEVLCGRPA
jgi:hypothetical protein